MKETVSGCFFLNTVYIATTSFKKFQLQIKCINALDKHVNSQLWQTVLYVLSAL